MFYTLLDLLKEGKGEENGKEQEDTSQAIETFPENNQEESESITMKMGSSGDNGNGTNGNGSNGHDQQLDMILSSYTFEVSPTLRSILAQDGNGSQKKNGRVILKTVNVAEMLEDVLSEFGLTSKKKTSLKEEIHAMKDLIA